MKKIYMIISCMAFITMSYSQFTLYFQGAEGTCQDNWGFAAITNAGGAIPPGIVTVLPRTGTRSIRAAGGNTVCSGGVNCITAGQATGCAMHGNTITFNTVNITGYTGVQLTFYHRTHTACSGSGFDSGDNLNFEASLNGGPFSTIMSPAIAGSGDAVWGYTLITYNVPAGTTTFAFRVRATVNRSDEVFYVDDVRLTATGGVSTVTWNGSVSTDWFCPSNWTPAIVPTPTISAVFSTDNAVSQRDIVLTAGTTAQCNDLSIIGGTQNDFALKGENGATKILSIFGNLSINGQDGLDFSDGANGTADGQIQIRGNWDNLMGEGEFKQGNSTVIFNGTGNQSIACAGGGTGEIFYNLQVNKASGTVTLSNNIEVGGNTGDLTDPQNGVFTLTSANVITGANNILVSNTAIAAVAGGSATSFVDGNLRRMTAATGLYDYPTGEGIRFMRAGIRTTNTSANTIEVNANNTGYGIYTPLESTLFDVSHVRWWDVTKLAGSTPVSVRLYWFVPASDGITNVSDLVVAHYSNRDHSGTASTTQWWNRGRSTTNSSALITNGFVESQETMTTYSPFTISTLTPVNPLPVELLSFTTTCEDGIIKANWSTASELNNDRFELEGSTDAYNYHVLKNITGAGNSNVVISYQTEINNIYRDKYFRLIQIDFNGNTTTYNPVYMDCEEMLTHLQATCNGNFIQVNIPSDLSALTLSMMDMNGKTLYFNHFNNVQLNNIIQIPKQDLPAGIYIVNAMDEIKGNVYVCKIFIY